jgi:putative oxidoreductase
VFVFPNQRGDEMDVVDVGVGLALLRVVVGLTLAAHGAQKLFGWWSGPGIAGFSGWLGSMGIRNPRMAAIMAGVFEFFGGILFALGLLTPLAALLIVIVMVTAIATVHWKAGFWSANGGYEFNLLIIASAVAVTMTGPGRYSLDHALELTDDYIGVVWGLGVLAAGIVIAGINLALRDNPAASSGADDGDAVAT